MLGWIVGGMIIAGIVAAFWDDLVDWLDKAVRAVKATVRGIYLGVRIFVQKFAEGVREISRHYSKVDGYLEETTKTRIVSASEVPEDILRMAYGGQEVDITRELELQLSSH